MLLEFKRQLVLGKSQELTAGELDRLRAIGPTAVSHDAPRDPRRLNGIQDPPLVLYMNGSV
jgi:predicted Rossmann fold nucleotide-binding protein DprA/Smf involved in DNA uptake